MPRLIALFSALVLALLLLPSAASAATCSVREKEQTLGPTYVTRLTVKGTSCAAGQRLVKSYFNCRKANGGTDGRCRKRVSGYRCTEGRRDVNPRTKSYDVTVTCRNGSRRVVHDYEQFV